jgi:hypothetical protein
MAHLQCSTQAMARVDRLCDVRGFECSLNCVYRAARVFAIFRACLRLFRLDFNSFDSDHVCSMQEKSYRMHERCARHQN